MSQKSSVPQAVNSLSQVLMSDTPSLLVYLRAPTEILLQRIKQRSRPFEQNIAADYLQLIDAFYETWILKVDFCPVLRLPHEEFQDFNVTAQLERAVDEMRARIQF